MSFGTPEGGAFTEYGIRYDEYHHAAPGFVTTVTRQKWLAESTARKDNANEGIRCVVVERQVACSEWATA